LTGGSYYFLAEGYRRCDATTGVVIINMGVLLTLVWSHVLLHETVTPIMILGAVLALCGTLAVINTDRRKLGQAVANPDRKAEYGVQR
jgi:drug/metabolite transporter (DMT)-like permease